MIRPRRIAQAAVVAIAMVCLLSMFLVVRNVSERLDHAEAQASSRDKLATTNAAALADANAKVVALAEQVKALGQSPVVSSSPVKAPGSSRVEVSTGQVAVALQQYCQAHGECRGPRGPVSTVAGPAGETGAAGGVDPAGKDGTNGTNGKDGRGIASLMCGEDGRWLVTYTDGAAADAGSCRADVIPAPPAD